MIVFKYRLIITKVLILLLIVNCALGQSPINMQLTINNAVDIALANNPIAKNAELRVQSATNQQLSKIGFGNTEVNYQYGQLNTAAKDNYFEVLQNFGSPLTTLRKEANIKRNIILSEAEQKLAIKQLTADVKTAYMNLIYEQNLISSLSEGVKLYSEFISIVETDYNLGETTLLEKATLETQYADIQNRKFQAEGDYSIAFNKLQQIMFTTDKLITSDSVLEMYSIDFKRTGADKFYPHEYLSYFEAFCGVRQSEIQLEQSKFFPEIRAGYFNQQINNVSGFEGFKIGISLPLWFLPQKAKVLNARINSDIAKNEFEYQQFTTDKTIENLKIQLDKLFVQISYFRENALNLADILLKTSLEKLQLNEIEYIQYAKIVDTAQKIKTDYLDTLRMYNITAIQLEYYIN